MPTNGAPKAPEVLGVTGTGLVRIIAGAVGEGRPQFAAIIVGELSALAGETGRDDFAMIIDAGVYTGRDRFKVAVLELLDDLIRQEVYEKIGGPAHATFQRAEVTLVMKGAAT